MRCLAINGIIVLVMVSLISCRNESVISKGSGTTSFNIREKYPDEIAGIQHLGCGEMVEEKGWLYYKCKYKDMYNRNLVAINTEYIINNKGITHSVVSSVAERSLTDLKDSLLYERIAVPVSTDAHDLTYTWKVKGYRTVDKTYICECAGIACITEQFSRTINIPYKCHEYQPAELK